MSFIEELKRRSVFKVTVAYGLVIEGPKDTTHSIRMITNWLDDVERIVSVSESP